MEKIQPVTAWFYRPAIIPLNPDVLCHAVPAAREMIVKFHAFYLRPDIFFISFSLFSASTGVRLFISRFIISSLICLSTGSSS
jgi:hypothetical protein